MPLGCCRHLDSKLSLRRCFPKPCRHPAAHQAPVSILVGTDQRGCSLKEEWELRDISNPSERPLPAALSGTAS